MSTPRLAPLCGALLLASAAAAADPTAPPPPITVAGAVDVASDYRFRGVSRSNGGPAAQGRVTISHESGVYVGARGSSVAGWGRFGGADLETDLTAGVRRSFGAAVVDAGVVWSMFPGGGTHGTDYAEPFVHLSGTHGPVTLTGTVAYAPRQRALGRRYRSGADAAAGVVTGRFATGDNLYAAGDAATAIPATPFTVKAHIGRSHGQDGLGPGFAALSPTGTYWDWSLGVDTAFRNLTLTLAYVDTDIRTNGAGWRRLQPSFSRGQDGTGSIAAATLVVKLAASF